MSMQGTPTSDHRPSCSSTPTPTKRASVPGGLLLVVSFLDTTACSSPNPDPVAYNGFVKSCQAHAEDYGGSDCDCIARALQANLDPSAFALFGRYQDLNRRGIVYSDGTLAATSDEGRRAHAELNLYFREVVQKHNSGSLSTDLDGLAEGLGACGGALGNNAGEIASMFTGANLIREFSGAR